MSIQCNANEWQAAGLTRAQLDIKMSAEREWI